MQDTSHQETPLSYHLYQHNSGTALLNPWQCNSSNEGTLPQLGKTHQKETKVKGGKTKQSGRFYYPFSWVLNYSSQSLKWFWNSHKHTEKTEACKRPCPRGTKQNGVRKLGNIWLAQVNKIRQKMKFWLECGHAGSKQLSPTLTSVLMPWATAVSHSTFWRRHAWFHPPHCTSSASLLQPAAKRKNLS